MSAHRAVESSPEQAKALIARAGRAGKSVEILYRARSGGLLRTVKPVKMFEEYFHGKEGNLVHSYRYDRIESLHVHKRLHANAATGYYVQFAITGFRKIVNVTVALYRREESGRHSDS